MFGLNAFTAMRTWLIRNLDDLQVQLEEHSASDIRGQTVLYSLWLRLKKKPNFVWDTVNACRKHCMSFIEQSSWHEE
jgi:hypothetical protein